MAIKNKLKQNKTSACTRNRTGPHCRYNTTLEQPDFTAKVENTGSGKLYCQWGLKIVSTKGSNSGSQPSKTKWLFQKPFIPVRPRRIALSTRSLSSLKFFADRIKTGLAVRVHGMNFCQLLTTVVRTVG